MIREHAMYDFSPFQLAEDYFMRRETMIRRIMVNVPWVLEKSGYSIVQKRVLYTSVRFCCYLKSIMVGIFLPTSNSMPEMILPANPKGN